MRPILLATLALLTGLLLTGCGQRMTAMTNEQIIAETAKCKKAGMKAQALVYALQPEVTIAIQCGQVSPCKN